MQMLVAGMSRLWHDGLLTGLALVASTICNSSVSFGDDQAKALKDHDLRSFAESSPNTASRDTLPPGDFRWSLEIDYGAGGYKDLSYAITDDSVGHIGRASSAIRLRANSYLGPVGLRAVCETQFKPMSYLGTPVINDFPEKLAQYSLYQIIASVDIRMLGSRVRLEPLVGYGWLNEKMEIRKYHPGDFPKDYAVVRADHRNVRGAVIGSEQSLFVSPRKRIRATLTYGRFGGADTRLQTEFQWCGSDIRGSETGGERLSKSRLFFAIGTQFVWRADQRRGWAVYLGGGSW
ncbi:MAG: hypothetical protein HZB43_10050 [candidate division Zixibacteria bacterium]|nr:hypothetical protein [candidate division Zixibacteria bacterium]